MKLLPESVKDKFVQQVAEQGLNTGQNIADGKDMFGQFVLFITSLRENYTLKCSLIPSVEDATKSTKTNVVKKAVDTETVEEKASEEDPSITIYYKNKNAEFLKKNTLKRNPR